MTDFERPFKFLASALLVFGLALSANTFADTPGQKLFYQAYEFQKAGKLQEAATKYEAGLKVEPKNGTAYFFLGDIYDQLGQKDRATKAFKESLRLEPDGQYAAQIETRLKTPAVPKTLSTDPTKIVLPSGLTLLDAANTFDDRMKSESPLALLKEVSQLIKQYGNYPKLVEVQGKLIAQLQSQLKVTDETSARANLPQIRQLRSTAPKSLELLLLEGNALHYTGNFTGAKERYSEWLQMAPATHTRRKIVVAMLQGASQNQALLTSVYPEMVAIPAGNFRMGSTDSEADRWGNEGPLHTVEIKAFEMGRTEVTQGQWKAVMGDNPSFFKDCGDDCPVETVSWDDVQEFIRRLNEKTGLQYRLPSEAEWEYACRGGRNERYCGGNEIDAVAWYVNNSGKTIHPVAGKTANAFGVHDMSGNVWEWVADCHHPSYDGAPQNGAPWVGGTCENRVARGGGWSGEAHLARAAYRFRLSPGYRYLILGFRLARTL